MLFKSKCINLEMYAQNKISDYRDIKEIPNKNLKYLNSGISPLDMSYMFHNCKNLKNIPKLDIDTINVNNMASMFSECSSLTSLDLTSLNISNVINMSFMFFYCSDLEVLDISTWNTNKVKDMTAMFALCKNLKHIKGVLDLKNCKEYVDMFYDCSKLTNVKIKNSPINFEYYSGLSSNQYEIVS